MNIIKLLKISDLLTFVNIIAGVLCIFLAANGDFKIAALLMFVSVAFDYFDGKSAKKRNIANEFGKQLDSLADIVSFGVTPAAFVFLMFKDLRFAIVYLVYVLAGIIRLARFNVDTKPGFFEGMPITVNGILTPVLYFIFMDTAPYAYYIYFLAAAFLMVSSIRFRKL